MERYVWEEVEDVGRKESLSNDSRSMPSLCCFPSRSLGNHREVGNGAKACVQRGRPGGSEKASELWVKARHDHK